MLHKEYLKCIINIKSITLQVYSLRQLFKIFQKYHLKIRYCKFIPIYSLALIGLGTTTFGISLGFTITGFDGFNGLAGGVDGGCGCG